jgi:hypothetical protein
MLMKISLALGERRPLSRQTAWGCLTANMALPGSGSLPAGRISGYPQLLFAIVGTVLTTVFGVRLLLWMLANWARLRDPAADHREIFLQMWLVLRWALLGMGLFAVSWLWALATGYDIVRSARNETPAPPKLS